ncbi:hypothetical protein HY229_09275 [Candidatus Acetothermia bacterium]|nr:hypothetical protein [Candidatus Acetothermia bacterium]MBI3644273.1 hypothetical protein [Candidatus Acetothermia bacterium]
MIRRTGQIALFFIVILALNASALDLLCMMDLLETGPESSHDHLDGSDTLPAVPQQSNQPGSASSPHQHEDGMDCQMSSTAGPSILIALHLPVEGGRQVMTSASPNPAPVLTVRTESAMDFPSPFHSPLEKPPQVIS